MKKVLLLTSSNNPLERQIPENKHLAWGEYIFQIGRKPSEEFDYLVILDNYDESIQLNCPKSKMVLFTGEPHSVKIYPSKYLNQFGSVFSCQKRIGKKINFYLSMPPLPWMTGCVLQENSHTFKNLEYMTYNNFLEFSNYDRLNKICIITSNKKLTKGHRSRVNFALKLKSALSDKVDIFGNGFMSIPDKFEIQSIYKYSIVIENCAYADYWTEKLADTYLAGSFPIYYGAPNITDYFLTNEIRLIDINNFDHSLNIIKEIFNNDLYDKSKDFINEAKIKVLNYYNTFSIISSCLDKIKYTRTKEVLSNFEPIRFSLLDSVKQRIIRLLY